MEKIHVWKYKENYIVYLFKKSNSNTQKTNHITREQNTIINKLKIKLLLFLCQNLSKFDTE